MAARKYNCTWDQIGYLDADHMKRWGAFEHGCKEIVYFHDEEHPVLAYAMAEDRDQFQVAYWWNNERKSEDEPPTRCNIAVERRPCRFGGHRVYFRCSSCDRSTLRLAILPYGLLCGRCGSITWGSRREHRRHRLIRRANKIARKLGLDDWRDHPNERPLHMRTPRFHRLKAEHESLRSAINRRAYQRLLRSPEASNS